MPTNFLITSILISSVLLFGPAVLEADEPKKSDPTSTVVDAASAKEKALQWIGKYRKKQVLFHDKDIARVQEQLQSDSPEAALKWWSKTAEMREALDSPEWEVTRQWFKEFLKVQAIYSDEQIEEFRQETKDAVETDSAPDFKAMLGKIETMRTNLIKGAADSKALREQKLSVLNSYRQQETTQRAQAAAHTAARTDTISKPVTPRAPRYAPAPLIDSMDVARWSLMRGLWRN